MKEQLWEIDTSNRNNLVFYGIKEDDSGSPEAAIKDVIRRFDLWLKTSSFLEWLPARAAV